MANTDYSAMGRRSWEVFHKKYSHYERKKLMAEKGRKGWLAIVAKFDGDEGEAKKYMSALARAIYFRNTRAGFARSLVEPYFDKFPNLHTKF